MKELGISRVFGVAWRVLLKVSLFLLILFFFIRGFIDWNEDSYECTLTYYDYELMRNVTWSGSLSELKFLMNNTEHLFKDDTYPFEGQHLVCNDYHFFEHNY